MIIKTLAIDITLCKILARELGQPYFPVEAKQDLDCDDRTNLVNTLVTC